MPGKPVDRLRKICRALPETFEKMSHGEPSFWVHKRMFAMFADAGNHHGGGRHAVWCKATHMTQNLVVSRWPRRYFVPPYVGPSGWFGMYLDRGTDWDEVAERLSGSYRLVAPKRLIAAPDGTAGEDGDKRKKVKAASEGSAPHARRKTPKTPAAKGAKALDIDPRFVPIVDAFASDRQVTCGKLMSSVGLKVTGKIFAMVVRGKLVVKLPKDQVDALVRGGKGAYFDPGHGRLMKQWIEVPPGKAPWLDLAKDAHRFVKGEQRTTS